jgi:DEAD/DEAH box helicase domain-containing protein
MPRKPIGEKAMTDAERQARYRVARAADAPVIRTRRPADHRSRAWRWQDAVAQLCELQNCRQPGCVRCCSSCVLASDLATRSDSMNRKAALQFLNSDFGKMSEPSPGDVAAPGALLSIDVRDEVVAAATRGVSVVLWPDRDFDPAALGAVRMRYTLSRLQANGASVAVCLEKLAIAGLDAAQKLALRDSAIRHGLQVAVGGQPIFANGAVAIVALSSGRTWASRDGSAGQVGEEWGLAARRTGGI